MFRRLSSGVGSHSLSIAGAGRGKKKSKLVLPSGSSRSPMSNGAHKSRGDPEDGCTDHSDSHLANGSTQKPEHHWHDRNDALHAKLSPAQSIGIMDHRTYEGQLWRQAELLAHAEKIGCLGTWEFEVASRTLILSDNLCKLLGCPPGTQFTEEDYWSMVHPADREQAEQLAASATDACKPYEYVARMYALDGSVRWHLMAGAPVGGENGSVERVIGVYRDVTGQARSEDELHKLSQQLIRARDDERRHMARDLHESAGQTLAALKMSLARVQDELPEDCETARDLLRFSYELASTAVREVRTVSYLMHPPMLDEAGLDPALRWYARGFSERSMIRVDVDIAEDFGRQSQEIEITIFRVVQEALTNVHRYSGSRTASIRLTRDRESICVEIEDTGCGIPLMSASDHQMSSQGVGIAGMRERIKELNGTFQIESSPGRGTTIRTILPLVASDDAKVREFARRQAQSQA
jgi:PAS domain S-box-containing protein